MKNRLLSAIDQLAPKLREVSLFIHKNPEIAFEEHKAQEALTRLLEASRFDVKRGVGGLATAFTGEYGPGSSHPVIGFISEYDALPGIGHGCGHNLIGPSSVGAAIALSSVLGPGSCRLKVIGTPAEERGGGKIRLVEAGIFNGLDAAMMVHPANKTEVIKRSLALIDLEIEFFGKASHAAGSPHVGINALDAVIQTFNNIAALRQHIRPDARIHGIITNGGQAPNIIPDYTKARFLVRSIDQDYAFFILERVKECAKGASRATGAKVKFKIDKNILMPFRPNYTMADIYRGHLKSLGVKTGIDEEYKEIGSSDIGNVSQVVPTIHPALAICDYNIAPHSIEFTQAAGSVAGIKGMLLAAKAISLTALDLITRPDLLRKVKDEHDRGGSDLGDIG
ncbi:MAG TPA: M20 family metallopeptidase, partial [Nitrospiria bacterium]|nr:M20 family metallopeptidase [Nitrospiria bacterium]